MGTPAYLAPEQAAEGELSGQTDMYALGVMLFEALVGRPPVEGSSWEVLMAKQHREIKPPSAYVDGVPPEIVRAQISAGYPFAIVQFLGFGIFMVAALAELLRIPFDMPIGESEIVMGYLTEYSGFRFLFFFIAEYANMWLVSILAVILFLGGWLTGIGWSSLSSLNSLERLRWSPPPFCASVSRSSSVPALCSVS